MDRTNLSSKLWLRQVTMPALIVLALYLASACQTPQADRHAGYRPWTVDTLPSPTFLSKEESLAAIQVPRGYHLELIASDPAIVEPVAIAWDGNGRMYVAEMRTYMQDIDATGQDEPLGRVSRLEDTDGDGIMDKHTVYIDSLLLPRMILCVSNRVYLAETYTHHIWAYEDTDGDGIADYKELAFDNPRPNRSNMEHQRSGMIWNLDNRIYVTIEPVRYKYQNGKLEAEHMEAMHGQWGLANDNEGRLYFSSAGGEVPATGFQLNPQYGHYRYPGDLTDGFTTVYPIIAAPDVQGGPIRLRRDSTLNRFTACCGQSVYRGDALPWDVRGDLFICEPVGRLIRRAKVYAQDGFRTLINPAREEEFIASTDMNFRPVNTATGPDGCLYIVDMHRGIIQEGAWTREGSFLRGEILKKGLDKNVGRGRIYRLKHEDYKPGKRPDMLDAPDTAVVAYLSHPNGWWRETAQKELVARGALSNRANQQLRQLLDAAITLPESASIPAMHALWTLEGVGMLDKKLLVKSLFGTDEKVRLQAIRISEQFLAEGDTTLYRAMERIVRDIVVMNPERLPDMRMQLVTSLSMYPFRESDSLIHQLLGNRVEGSPLFDVHVAIKNRRQNMRNARTFGPRIGKLDLDKREWVIQGQLAYNQTCASCHGPSGKGVEGAAMLAPSLVGSPRLDESNTLIRIMLHGLSGPLDGKEYANIMAPFGAKESDEWVAQVLSYIQCEFGDGKPEVTPDMVRRIRNAENGKSDYWTQISLDAAKKLEVDSQGR